MRANRQRAFYIPLLSFLPLVSQAAILLIGGRMVANGTLSIANFVRFNLYLAMLVMPLRALGMWIGQAQRATASGERIFQVIDEPEDIADAPDARELPAGRRPRASSTASRSATTRSGRCFEDVSLELAAGRVVALIGHTGAGKTTLASLVPRFYDVQRGRVTIDGADVRDLKLTSLRRAIGVIAQDPFLFSATVRENIAFGRADATDEEVERAARLAQAHEFVEALPEGYDTVIGERGITLSGGQRQRVAIARALVVDPRILILDDATASVDATTESKIRDGLREAMRGRTTIIIAHRLSTIALADEIVVLDDGRVVFHGSQADARDERRLPRDRGPRDARADLRRGRGMRVHQPGSHLMRGGRPQVDDWSWAQTKRRLATLYRLARPYKPQTLLAIVSLLGATVVGARSALPRRTHDRPREARVDERPRLARRAVRRRRRARDRVHVRPDVLHRLDRRAHARRPPQPRSSAISSGSRSASTSGTAQA